MNLQISETIHAHNPELVLRTLEECLRGISIEVDRNGNQLTAFGIGPSHRMKNRNDKATLDVIPQQDAILVHTHATFQASALMGDQPQDEVVRSKFDRVFDCLKAELLISTLVFDPLPVAPAEAVPPEPAQALEITSEPSRLTPAPTQTPAPSQTAPPSHTPAASLSVAATPPIEAPEAAEPQDSAPPAEADLLDIAKPDAPLEPARIPDEPSTESAVPPRHLSRGFRIALASLLTLCLLFAPTVLRRYVPDFTRSSAPPKTATTDSISATPPAPADRTPSASVPPAESSSPALAPPPPASAEQPAQKTPEALTPENQQNQPVPSSILQRVVDWGTALRSRDAFAQTSFYSIRVHPYFEYQDVGLDFVLHDKQAEIQKRQGLWTVKLENIVIEQETPFTARVRLVKHYIDQPSQGAVIERLVPTLLHFKRVGGQWYITAEHNLP